VRYVVDTNIFNRIADQQFSCEQLPPGSQIVATHVQLDELNQTTDPQRKAALLQAFGLQQPEMLPTESAVWDVSKWDAAKWGDGATHQQIRAALDAKNGGRPNNAKDALIAEVALKNGFGLVTADRHLAEVAQQFTKDVIHVAP